MSPIMINNVLMNQLATRVLDSRFSHVRTSAVVSLMLFSLCYCGIEYFIDRICGLIKKIVH